MFFGQNPDNFVVFVIIFSKLYKKFALVLNFLPVIFQATVAGKFHPSVKFKEKFQKRTSLFEFNFYVDVAYANQSLFKVIKERVLNFKFELVQALFKAFKLHIVFCSP